MEYEQDDNNQEDGMWDRIKESPRTVSVLIIILIVAAAIYAFSDDQQTEEDTAVDGEITEEVAVSDGEEAEATEEGAMSEDGADMVAATPSPVSSDDLAAENDTLPTPERNDEGFVETAQAGDGITHLARRATTRYLNENEAGFTLTNEHRIYIEDYIQNRIGSQKLGLGEQIPISYQLIDEAVSAAEQLTPEQLNNLTQYSSALM